MKILKQVLVLIMVGGMFTPALSAQSVWQKMKQSVQQAERNAQAQQHQTQPTSAKASSPSAAASGGTASTGAEVQTSTPADLSSPAMKALYRKLDVGGVALGMTSKEAQAVIQSRNRTLAPSSTPFGFTDLPTTSFVSKVTFQTPGSMDEIQDLYLTLQPMQPEVLSIRRYTRYNEHNVPTVNNTIAALQAKYGPETSRKIEQSGEVTTLFWLFDGEGRLVPENHAKDPNQDLIGWCAAGEIELDVREGLRSGGFSRNNLCAPLTVVRAELHEWEQTRKNSHGQSLPRGMLFQMFVTASSYPLMKESTTATLKMLVDARDARQKKEQEGAEHRAAPL